MAVPFCEERLKQCQPHGYGSAIYGENKNTTTIVNDT